MTEISLPPGALETLAGNLEENFRYLSERLRIRLSARGVTVTLDGEPGPVQLAAKLLEELGRLVELGSKVSKEECAKKGGKVAPPAK